MAATQERIEARISADEKRLLEDAAQRRGMTLTAFVLSTAHDAAVRTLETAHVAELTRQDQQRFVETLLNPPAPSCIVQQLDPDTHNRAAFASGSTPLDEYHDFIPFVDDPRRLFLPIHTIRQLLA